MLLGQVFTIDILIKMQGGHVFDGKGDGKVFVAAEASLGCFVCGGWYGFQLY